MESRHPTHLRDTLPVLSSVKLSPGNSARVLALKEQRLGLAVLETEDFAVATNVELALFSHRQPILPLCCTEISFRCRSKLSDRILRRGFAYLARVDLLTGESVVVGPHVGGT